MITISSHWVVTACATLILFIVLVWLFYARWKEDRVTIRYWQDATDRCEAKAIELRKQLETKA